MIVYGDDHSLLLSSLSIFSAIVSGMESNELLTIVCNNI